MSSTAVDVDSHSPPVEVPQSSESDVLDNKDDQKVEESVEHDTKNAQEVNNHSAATQTSVTLTKIDLLGFGNDKAVKGGATGAPAGGKSNEVVQIPADQSGVDENRYEIIYSFPPDSSVLNINGRLRFELVTVRENGRLQIFMEPYRCSQQLVRSPLRNGRLRMWLLNDDQSGGEKASPPQRREDDRILE